MFRLLTGCLAAALVSGCAVSSAAALPGGGEGVVTVEVFHQELAPFGDWVLVGGYGRVWRPHVALVGPGFHPYVSGGRWVYTDYGWSFESDYPWGWAPFHYGRWLLDGVLGWVWVPDVVWGPAWVSWRFGGGYAGWAPLPPQGATFFIETHAPYWTFVETRHFAHHGLHQYRVRDDRFHAAMAVAAPMPYAVETHRAVGPPPDAIAVAAGVPVHAARITPPPPRRTDGVRTR